MSRLALFFLFMPAWLVAQPSARNLIDMTPAAWRTWSPRPDLMPRLEATQVGGAPAFSMRAQAFPQYGMWYTLVKGIRGGAYYRFDAMRRSESVRSDDMSVVAMLSWCRDDCTTDAVQRDYVDREEAAGEWRRVYRTLRAPADAKAVKVELVLRWTGGGSVVWKQPSLVETGAPKPRVIRVATTHIVADVPSTVDANLKLMAGMLDKAGAEKVDVVCLSENVVGRGVNMPASERARAVAEPTMKLLAGKAKQYRMYVLTTIEEPDGNLVYNTALLYDREGKLAAKYRKMHLPLAEAEIGYTPGSEYQVLDTDFGRVGIVTCWDNWFSETARIVRLNGAEILLFPVAGDVEPHWDIITRARAIDNGLYVIASSMGSVPSRIIDPSGEVLAEARGAFGIAVKDIDLNKEWRTPWLSIGPGLGEGKSLFIKERRPDMYAPLAGPR
jgi:predicted amidohydrolase